MPPPKHHHPWHSKDAKTFFGKHKGATAFVVAYGPSLRDFDWSCLEGKLVIGLNNSIRKLIPTYWFFCDATIWKANENAPIPEDLPVIIPATMKHLGFPWPNQAYGVRYVGNWDPTAESVFMRGTVATAGTCFAWHLGARRIVLLGVDCYAPAEGAYYADGTRLPEPQYKRAVQAAPGVLMEPRHEQWLVAFREVDEGFKGAKCYQEGLEIYNCSESSRLNTFPKKPLADFLEEGG